MPFALLANCFRSGTPAQSEESLDSDCPRGSETSILPIGKGNIIFQDHGGKLRSSIQSCTPSTPRLRTRGNNNEQSYSAPTLSSHAQIQRILATANISPTGEGPLCTLSKASMHATCEGMEVPLGVVVFEDAEDRNGFYAQQSSGLTGEGLCPSFEMQPDLWQFQFKVRCIWVNSAHAEALDCTSSEKAMSHISGAINKNTALRCDLLGLLKSIEHGHTQPIQTWNTYYGQGHAELFSLWLQPCLWVNPDGSKFIACLTYTEPQPSHQAIMQAMAPDHTCLECIPSSVTTVDEEGFICSQNAASRASFGPSLSFAKERGINFLQELFHGHQDLHAKMQRRLKRANSFHVCVQLLSPLLREWLNLVEAEEVWHQLYITQVTCTSQGGPSYVIVQTDITDKVLAERKVAQLQQQHQGLLREILPPEVMEAILRSKCMVQAARAVRADAHELSSCQDGAEDGGAEDGGAAQRLSRQCSQLHCSGAQLPQQAPLSGKGRGRRPSQLLCNSNSQLLSSMDVSHHSKTPGLQDLKGVWLTQQDVQNLATTHESVTILFADIKGFTALSQQLQPAEVMLFLNQLYSIWDAMLDSYGVYKVETIGDSYMVAGGLFSSDPVTKTQKLGGYDPRHAQKVLDFGRAMLESASLVLDPRGAPVQIRIGIHSGDCVSGIVGQRMPRFCLFGDTINTASRMESNCPRPGCIHASQASQALLPHEPWVPTGGVFCKGKGVMQSFYIPVTADVGEEQEGAKLAAPAPAPVAVQGLHAASSSSLGSPSSPPSPLASSLYLPTSLVSTACCAPPLGAGPRPADAAVAAASKAGAGASASVALPEVHCTHTNPTWVPHSTPLHQLTTTSGDHAQHEPAALRVRAHICAHTELCDEGLDSASPPLLVFGSVVSQGQPLSCSSLSLQQAWMECADCQPSFDAGPRPSAAADAPAASVAPVVAAAAATAGPHAQPGCGTAVKAAVALHVDPLLPPATPGLSTSRSGSWKVTSCDGRSQVAGQQSHSHTPRRSKITEQAQRVLQELNQSRPKPKEVLSTMKSMKGVTFERIAARELNCSRASVDLPRLNCGAGAVADGGWTPRRGSLDLAWASVNKFRRSHSPGPSTLMEGSCLMEPLEDATV